MIALWSLRTTNVTTQTELYITGLDMKIQSSKLEPRVGWVTICVSPVLCIIALSVSRIQKSVEKKQKIMLKIFSFLSFHLKCLKFSVMVE